MRTSCRMPTYFTAPTLESRLLEALPLSALFPYHPLGSAPSPSHSLAGKACGRPIRYGKYLMSRWVARGRALGDFRRPGGLGADTAAAG